MAVWVTFTKAKTFPAVTSAQAYKPISRFRKAVRAEAFPPGSAVWARRKTGPLSGDANLEVDVEAIPGVRPLTRSGAKKG